MKLSLTMRCALVLAASAVLAAGGPAATIEDTKSVVGKWVATQELIFKERKAWRQEKELLQSRIELVEREVAELSGKVTDAKKVLAEQAAKRSTGRAEEVRYAGLGSDLGNRVSEFEGRIRELHKSLPDPVREKVDALYRRIPADGERTQVSVAERYQNVLGILNEVNRLNGEITLATEIRPLSDGKPSEVKTVYVGLGQAYYISARGEAGIGAPGPDGWVWRPANELAREIGTVIQVLQNQAKPSFVSLPVTIQ